jgi:hypothetical protein
MLNGSPWYLRQRSSRLNVASLLASEERACTQVELLGDLTTHIIMRSQMRYHDGADAEQSTDSKRILHAKSHGGSWEAMVLGRLFSMRSSIAYQSRPRRFSRPGSRVRSQLSQGGDLRWGSSLSNICSGAYRPESTAPLNRRQWPALRRARLRRPRPWPDHRGSLFPLARRRDGAAPPISPCDSGIGRLGAESAEAIGYS